MTSKQPQNRTHSNNLGTVSTNLFLKVSRLEGGAGGGGGASSSRAEKSPYVLSQLLLPFQMLLAGILLGFVCLLAEIKMVKKIMARSKSSTRSIVTRPSRSIGRTEANLTSIKMADLESERPKIHKMVRFGSKFENMVIIEL